MVKTMLERDVDGLILSPAAGTTTEALQKWMQYCALVLLNPYYSDLAADCVGMDDENGTERAIEHLIQQGQRRIAFVGGYEATSTRQWRLHSYRETLQKHSIEYDPALCITGPVSRQGGYDAVHQLLSMSDPPAAAYCFSDVIAFGVMLGLRAAGIEAGQDLRCYRFRRCPGSFAVASQPDDCLNRSQGDGRTSRSTDALPYRGTRYAHTANYHAIAADRTRIDRGAGLMRI